MNKVRVTIVVDSEFRDLLDQVYGRYILKRNKKTYGEILEEALHKYAEDVLGIY